MVNEEPSSDVFATLPDEIRKNILNCLDTGKDALKICSLSAAMYRASTPLPKQILECELGSDVVSKVFLDAHGFISFPDLAQFATDDENKAAIKAHLTKWRNGDLLSEMTDAEKLKASRYLQHVVVPFAKDFAHKNEDIRGIFLQLRFPDWSHPCRLDTSPHAVGPALTAYHKYYQLIPSRSLKEFSPAERVRLIRAFCRFDIMSKAIKARPGDQLYTLAQQKVLLAEFFDAWEVEEVLCVQKYVLDLHVLLMREYMAEIPRFLRAWSEKLAKARAIGTADEIQKTVAQAYAIFRRRSYTQQVNASADHVKATFKMRNCLGAEVPIRKLPFLDVRTQSTFIQQIATFGLTQLHGHLSNSAWDYVFWLREHQDELLAGMSTREQAAYFGADPDFVWIFDERRSNLWGSDADSENGKKPVAHFGRDPGDREEAEANLAWRLLKNASTDSIEAFRRCGWVFWDEDRLRAQPFWKDADHEPVGEESPLAWVMEPFSQDAMSTAQQNAEQSLQAAAAATAASNSSGSSDEDEDDGGSSSDDAFDGSFMSNIIYGPFSMMQVPYGLGSLSDDMSAADIKLARFKEEDRDRGGHRWGLDNPIHPLVEGHRAKVVGREDWDAFMGPIGLETPDVADLVADM